MSVRVRVCMYAHTHDDGASTWMPSIAAAHTERQPHPQAVVELIRDIGCFAAWIDDKWEYVKRSFCIIELYAAVLGNCKRRLLSITCARTRAHSRMVCTCARIRAYISTC